MSAASVTNSCEVSWFSALCDDDYEFLGQPDPRLKSSWEHCRDIVLAAETGGFDNILLPSGYALGIDTTVFASAIAVLTRRIRLLLAVRTGETWPPQLARQIATLDRLSQGRLTVNIISSEMPGENLASGPRYGRTVEVMQILKTLLNGQPLDHHGDHYTLKLDPPGVTTVSGRCPPLYFGGLSPDARAAAAKAADVYLMWPDTMPAVQTILDDMRARARRRAPHAPVRLPRPRHRPRDRGGGAHRRRPAAISPRRRHRCRDPRQVARRHQRRRPPPGRTPRRRRCQRRLRRGEPVDRHRPCPLGLRCRHCRRSRPGIGQAAGVPGDGHRGVHPVGLSARRRGRSVRAARTAADDAQPALARN